MIFLLSMPGEAVLIFLQVITGFLLVAAVLSLYIKLQKVKRKLDEVTRERDELRAHFVV